MPNASSGTGHATCGVSAADPWAILMGALGVATQQEVADRAGVDLRTLQRLFDRPERRLMRHAFRLRDISGVGLDEMFPRHTSLLSEAA